MSPPLSSVLDHTPSVLLRPRSCPLRRPSQDEFEQLLAARSQELEARFEARLADMRAELEAEYERRLAEKDAEIAELRLKCAETQDDLDQLLLCLVSARVG